MLVNDQASPASTSPHDLMAQLVEIQEPTPTWFMPAIGWWVITALGLLMLLWFLRRWRRYQQRQQQLRFWRIAQQQLSTLDLALPDTATGITQILKQVIMTAAPQHKALGLSGRAWQSYLQQSFADVAAMPCPDVTRLAYAADADSEALAQYHALAVCWLQAASRQGLPDVQPRMGSASTAATTPASTQATMPATTPATQQKSPQESPDV